MADHRRRIYDLAGVHQTRGIKQPFDLPKSFIQLRPVVTRDELAAHQPIAVFPGKHTAVLAHHFESLVRDPDHLLSMVLAMQVEDRAEMDHTDTGVGVHCCRHIQFAADLLQTLDVFGQHLDGDARVFDERLAFDRSLDVADQSQTQFADVPHVGLAFGIRTNRPRIADPLRLQVGHQGGDSLIGVILVFAEHLDQQHGFGTSFDESCQGARRGIQQRLAQHQRVQQFDRARLMAQDRGDMTQRIDLVVEMDDRQRSGLGQRRQPHGRFEQAGQRAFAAGDQMGQIPQARASRIAAADRSRISGPLDELVQVVPRDAAHHLGIAGQDLSTVPRHNVLYAAVDRRFAAIAVAPLLPVHLVQRLKVQHRPVGQCDFARKQVVDRLAVDQGPGARGVVSDHPAHGRPVAGRRIRRKVQPKRGQSCVQPVAHHPGLNASPLPIGIDLQHLVHVFRGIDHHAGAERLPGKRSAAAARRDRHPEASGDFDGRHAIRLVTRHHHAHRHHLVMAGVRRMHPAARPIEIHLAAHGLAQGIFKPRHIDILGHRPDFPARTGD